MGILDFQPQTLSQFKIAALKYGDQRILFEDFNADTKLWKSSFPAGKYMEIVMAWMIGYFRATCQVYLGVKCSGKLDKVGIDFLFQSGQEVPVDMKFDKDEQDDWHLSNADHIIVRTYPSEEGHSSSGTLMSGEEALKLILSTALRPSVIERALDGREEFLQIINSLWDCRSNGW